MHFGVYFHSGRTAIVVRFPTLYDRGQPHLGGFSFVFQGSCEENVSYCLCLFPFSFTTLTHNRWSCISTFMFVQYRYRYSYYSYLIDGIVLLGWLPNLSSDGYVFLVQNSPSSNLHIQLFPKKDLLAGSWNRRRSPFMRVSSLLMRMLEVTNPKCKVGHKFPGVKFYSHAISAGRSHKNNTLKIVRKVGSCFLEDF